MNYWEERVWQHILRMLRAEARKPGGAREAGLAMRHDIENLMVLAHMAGRRRTVMDMNAVLQGKRPAPPEEIVKVPGIPFREAMKELRDRHPEVASTAEEVSDVIRAGGYSMVKAPDVEIIKKVREVILASHEEGIEKPRAIDIIETLGPWSRSYAENVYRTTTSTAFNDGRMEMAKDPTIKRILPAFEFHTVGDPSVRNGINSPENHAAMNGLVASTDSPIWDEWRPPLGYQCRCYLRLVSVLELKRRGLLVDGEVPEPTVPAAAAKHPNFN